jgi:hypothetical protein
MRIVKWRNIFFFEGLFTVIVGLAAPFLMPTSPQDCWFLTERERMIATHRLVSKSGADENEKVEPHHVKRAVMNITNNFCALGFFFINITVQGISLFMVCLPFLLQRMQVLNYDSLLSWLISAGLLPRHSFTRYHRTFALVLSLLPLLSFPTKPIAEVFTSQSSRFLLLRASQSCDGQPIPTSDMAASS